MTEPLSLDDLAERFRQVDDRSIAFVTDTGRLSQRAASSVRSMVVAAACMALLTLLLGGVGAVFRDGPLLLLAASLGVLTAGFGVFTVRQTRSVWVADALLEGPAADLVRARQLLVEVEVRAWVGPTARLTVAGSGLALIGTVVLGALAQPVLLITSAIAVLWVGTMVGYGWWWRVPALREEHAELEALLEELA